MHLKPITPEGIPAALQKAERYRLLNESSAAESICLDVLEIEPANQTALVSLLLAITDQFIDESSDGVTRARAVIPRLSDEYERVYYTGIIFERRARAQLIRGSMGAADDLGQGPLTWQRTDSAKRCAGTRKRKQCVRPAMTKRFFAGTPVRGC